MQYEPEEISIQANNLRLSGLAWGDRSNPPVLALHGWLDNAASFVPLSRFFSQLYVVALDLPGHGKSEHRQGVNAYHFIDFGTDVIHAINSLEFDRFTLLGHSLGAGISALISSVIPDRVERLAMVEGIAPVTAPENHFNNQFRRHVDQSVKPPSEGISYSTTDQAARARQKAGDLSFHSAKLIVERNLQLTDEGYQWRTDRVLRKPSPVYLTEEHVKTYMNTIDCESLLIRSSDGIVLNWKSLHGRESYVNNLRIVDIDGGHHCHMDQPESVAEHLMPFLKSNRS